MYLVETTPTIERDDDDEDEDTYAVTVILMNQLTECSTKSLLNKVPK